MKWILLRIFFAFLTVTFISSAHAQQPVTSSMVAKHRSNPSIPWETGNSRTPTRSTASTLSIPAPPLPASIVIPGMDTIPVQGTWPQQSNDRALHNIQIDPSNPNRIHAVITGLLDNSGKDVGSLTRRIFYTSSSDGGKTWSTAEPISTTRSGYADMLLYERSEGVWVPIIAGHHLISPNSASVTSAIWVEKGQPGDGNFAQCDASMTSKFLASGSQSIIWPSIAISNDNKTVYMIASVSPASNLVSDEEPLQFGTYTLSADTATFNGWSAEPGAAGSLNNSGPSAGITEGGAYRIAVSSSGTVGVMWQNSQGATAIESPEVDGSIYYSQSNDGGTTWSGQVTPLLDGQNYTSRTVSDQAGDSIYYWTPLPYLDMWYDGNQPQFIYEGFYDDYSDGVYLPFSTELYYLPDTNESDTIGVANASLTATPGSGTIPNVLDIITSQVNDEGTYLISWPTVARTSDPNKFAVFYQTYLSGDFEALSSDTGTAIFPYGSIFYSSTLDGGTTWTDPIPFAANTGTGQIYDFRFPQTSYFNPTNGGSINYACMFAVDTGAGWVDSVGQAGFDVISNNMGTATVTFSGVSENTTASSISLENYPNPAQSATTITFSLPASSDVVLTLTDMLGRPVATLVNGPMSIGTHSVPFHAGALAGGVYRYTLEACGMSTSKSMTLIR